MSVITLPTRGFVGALGDAVLTASTDPDYPVLCAVLLHTARGDVTIQSEGDKREPPLIDVVTSDVLVATSTDGLSMISQCHTMCTGRLHTPLLIPVADAVDVVRVFTRLGKTAPKGETHHTQLELVGQTLTVSEDPVLCPEGREMSMQVLDLEDYPRDLAARMEPEAFEVVTDRVTGEVVAPTYGCGVPAVAHEVVGKVGRRRKMPATRWYQDHQSRGIVAEVGSQWRGLFRPVALEADEGRGPLVPVFAPKLPVEDPGTVPLAGS